MARCLILDDDPMFREILERIARGLGLDPTVVSNAPAAVDAILQRDYDVVLLDLRLAGDQNSSPVFEAIRRSKPHLLPRVLCVTGSPEMMHKVALDVPCVAKGNLETLGEKIRALL
ncbi:MAG TPA: response regulator [Thermoanaerobaculia bacterium]